MLQSYVKLQSDFWLRIQGKSFENVSENGTTNVVQTFCGLKEIMVMEL